METVHYRIMFMSTCSHVCSSDLWEIELPFKHNSISKQGGNVIIAKTHKNTFKAKLTCLKLSLSNEKFTSHEKLCP